MAEIIPQYFIKQQAIGVINFNTDEFKSILCSGTYNEASLRDSQTYANVSANEITSGNGYFTGGIDVSGTSAVVDDTNNRTLYKCADLYFTASGGNITDVRYAVMYDPDGENTLVYVFDFGENKTIADGCSLIVTVDTVGFMKSYQLT